MVRLCFVFFWGYEDSLLPVELSVSAGKDGMCIGTEEKGHLAIGGARMMLQVVFPGFLCKMEIVLCFCTGKPLPEFLQDLVDRPDLCQAHHGIGSAFGLFFNSGEIAIQDVVQQGRYAASLSWISDCRSSIRLSSSSFASCSCSSVCYLLCLRHPQPVQVAVLICCN